MYVFCLCGGDFFNIVYFKNYSAEVKEKEMAQMFDCDASMYTKV